MNTRPALKRNKTRKPYVNTNCTKQTQSAVFANVNFLLIPQMYSLKSKRSRII